MKQRLVVWIILGVGVLMTAVVTSCSRGLQKANIESRSLSGPLAINTKPRLLALGYGFSVGVKKDGSVWTWGHNHRDILARPVGSEIEGYTPAKVPNLSEAISVSAADCVLILKKDGTVWSWGRNAHGQLGYKTEEIYSAVPKMITGLSDVIDISTQAETSQALRRDGTVWGWGWSASGKLGFSEEASIFMPRQIEGLRHIVRIEVGMGASFAIDKKGVLWSYGNDLPRLGRAADKNGKGSFQPQKVSLPLPVVDVSAQSGASYALLSDGSVWSWGNNRGGELGTGESRSVIASVPNKIKSISGVVAIASADGGAGLTEAGEVIVWGVSAGGPPPAAPFPRHDLDVPHLLPFMTKMPARSFTGGLGVYALIDRDGNTWFWKANNEGQRGIGKKIERPAPEYWVTPEKSLWAFN